MMSKAMKQMVRRWTGTLAAGVVLAYAGTVAVTGMRDFALWQVNFLWVCALAVICGTLLALISDNALWSMVFASVMAALTLAGLWSYILWSFLGEHISYFELLTSNLFMLYVVPRSAMVFLGTMPLGLVAIIFTTMLVGTD